MRRPTRGSLIRLAAVLVAIAAVAWLMRPQPMLVETVSVTRGTLEATVTAEGKTRVRNLFVITSPVDGELGRIALKAGDSVTPATVVAQLRPVASRPLDPRTRAEAEAAVTVARAAVRRAEAAEQEAVAALAHAESTSATSERLSREGVAAAKDAEHAGHELEIRRQALSGSRSAVQQARAELVRAEAAAASSPNQSKAVTDVHSPTAGRVLRVMHESGGPVTAGTPLLEIGNTNGLEIAADFLTTDAVSVQSGAPAYIRDWGGDHRLAARVRHVEPGAFTKVSALGLEEQRVSVVLDLLDERPATVGNDFHVNAAVVVWKGADVLTVPSTALFRVGNDWALFTVQSGRARLTHVVLGRSDGTRTVIERGVADGDQVVVQRSDALVDGSRVQPSDARTR